MADSVDTTPTDGIMDPEAFTAMMHLHSGALIRTALDLGLPDEVADSGSAVTELAERLEADPGSVRRLLRVLSTIGVFRSVEGDAFAHTPGSQMLRSTSTNKSLVDTFVRNGLVSKMWDHLPDAVRSGEAAFPEVGGKPFYDYLNEDDPELAASFNASMTHGLGTTNDAVVEALDLRSTTEIVDMGGGQGTLLRDLLRANPHLRGTLFDIAHALVDVDHELRSGELAERCGIVEGDARVAVPEGADAYVLRTILHNWDDESCVRMLSSIARDAAPGARVLIVEVVMPENGDVAQAEAMFDIMMFATFGSCERSESEYAALFERAGLKHVGTSRTSSMFGVIEAQVR